MPHLQANLKYLCKEGGLRRKSVHLKMISETIFKTMNLKKLQIVFSERIVLGS